MTRFAPALALLAVAIAYFAPAIADGRMLAPGDGIAYYFDVRVVAFAAVKAGEMPFWNPYLFSGTPFLAAIQPGLFFPGNWTFLFLSPYWAMNATVIGAFWTAGLGAYAFGRAAGQTRLGAWAAGLAFMLGGFLVFNAQHLTMVQAAGMLGFVLWAVERFRVTLRSRYALAGAGLLALQILAGHPQMTAYSTIVAGLYALWRMRGLGPALPRYIGQLALMLGVGVGLALLQLLPTLDLIQASQRQAISYERLVISSLAYEALPTLLMPFLYGSKLVNAWFPTPTWTATAWRGGVEGYVGIATLLLAAVAVFRWRHAPQARFWAGIALVTFLLALGDHTPLYRLWALLPVVKMMPFASRHFFECTFALAMLAGWGVTAIARREARLRDLTLATGALGLAVFGLLAALAIFGPAFARRTQPFLPPEIDLVAGLAPTQPALWLPAAFLLLAAGGLFAARRLPRAGPALVAVALIADLAIFGHHQGRLMEAPHVPADIGATTRPVVDHGAGRGLAAARWLYPYNSDNYDYLRRLRMPAVNMLQGAPLVNGYDAFILARYGRLLEMESDGYLKRPGLLVDEGHHVVDLLGLTRLRLDPVLPERPEWQGLTPPRWKKLADDEGVAVYENARALPRAWRVKDLQVLAPEAVDARVTNDASFAPRKTALVESPVEAGALTPGAASAETVSLNRIRLETSGVGPGFVVVSESFDPGWKAFLGDRELPVHRTDALLLGVAVPPGEHVIELRYAPRRWGAGLAGSGASLLLLLGWAALAWRRRETRGPVGY